MRLVRTTDLGLLLIRRASAFLVILLSLRAAAAAEPSGQQLFQTKCASCHGPHGEGTKKTKHRLEGDRTVAQLSEVIFKTMPEDDPGTLAEADVQAIANYIHGEFYSPFARERNRGARIELTRLTVNQYRQSVADLLGAFRWQGKSLEKTGLTGQYFKGSQYKPQGRIAERVDPQVHFDFGPEAPLAEKADKFDPHEFLIRWTGAVLAPETGEYEFIIRTDHAAKLWINDEEKPLIDAWVKSGDNQEYKETLTLLAGRAYSLRLEFSKALQGSPEVNKELKKKPPLPAFVSLDWKRPNGAPEPIPARQLSPDDQPEAFVCNAPFPPDDRSYGWERGTNVSPEWDQATTDAALEAANYLVAHLSELAKTKDDAHDRTEKIKSFCGLFAARAFRRPLSEPQLIALVDKQFAQAENPDAAVKRVALLVLKSPRFLYRELHDQPDAYDVASRLSYALWDSLPDERLLDAAAKSQLANKDQIARQAERMLRDPRAKAKLHDFLLTWLQANNPRDLAKDAKMYPDFDAGVISDLRTSLELFLDKVLASPNADFRELLLADYVFLNQRLAKFYGVQPLEEEEELKDFTEMKLNAQQRAGVLTHPYLMTSFAHSTTSSPIHRGVFLARGVLGLSLRPPPEAIAPLAPELHPDLTTRERVSLQTHATACMTCHGIINPLGFTLEHFDAVGRYREEDGGKPIDATGSYSTSAGRKVTLKDARELAKFLTTSEEAHAAFVEQLFHHLVQQPVRAYGPTELEDLRQKFESQGYNIRKLAVEIVATSALTPRAQSSEKTARTER